MIFIEWTKSLISGIDEIDKQHRELVDAMNALYSSIMLKREYEGIKPLADFLIDYARHHFSTEEKLMDEIDYIHREVHKNEHKTFYRKVEKVLEAVDTMEDDDFIELCNFLNSWLVAHIKHSDLEFAKYYRGKNESDNHD